MKKYLVLFSLLFLFPSLLCFSQPTSVKGVKSSYYNEGKYKKSVEVLKGFASSDSFSADRKKGAMKLLARSYLASGDFDKAYSTTQKLAKTEGVVNWDPTKQPRILNYAYYRSVRDSKGNYLVGSKEHHPNYLVLGVFRHKMGDFTVFGNSLSYFINKGLKNSGKTVVKRERTRWVIDEFTEDYLSITPEEAYYFGRLTGVDNVVFGSYKSGEDLEVVVNVLDTDKAQITSRKTFEVNPKSVVLLFEKVVSSLVTGNVNYSDSELNVVFRYSKALKMSFEDRYVRAEDLLTDVSNSHSKFEKAKKRLEAVDPIIAIYK